MNYLVDSPVMSSSDDFSERDEFVSALANVITSAPKGEPFTIGLFGEWGSGKTSVINFLEEKLNENNEEIKVIRFDPWIYSDDTQLLNQFFRVMAEELDEDIDKTGLKGISTAFEAYADASELLGIIPVVGGYLQRLGGAAGFVAEKTKEQADERNLAKIKERICKGLKESNKQFLVIIDDIDRLTNEQIRMVFQLVNSIAKFPNIIYLLSFDRKVVVRALADVQKGDGNDYLEKIIQVSVELPAISQLHINSYLVKLLEDLLVRDNMLNPERWAEVYFEYIEKKLSNFRDVKRFMNTFSFMFSSLHSEIDFADLACMVVLQIWEPELFLWVYQNRSFLTGRKSSYSPSNDEETVRVMEASGLVPTDYQVSLINYLFNGGQFGMGIASTMKEKDKMKVSGRVAHIDNLERVYHFALKDNQASISLLKKYTYEANVDELKEYLCETASEKQIEEFLSYINGVDVSGIKNRCPVILQVLLLAAAKMDVSEDYNPFSISGNTRLWFTVSDLARAIGVSETEKIIEEVLDDFDSHNVMAFSYFLKDQIQAHGQFENVTADETKQLVSLQFLKKLEDFFLSRIRSYSKEMNLLERLDFYTLPLLAWKHFEEKECEEYVDKSLRSSDKSVVLYAIRRGWVGVYPNKGSWIAPEDEDPKVPSSKALAAIDKYRLQDDFWDLPDYIKERVATFTLQKQTLGNEKDSVTLTQARAELRRWKKEYDASKVKDKG